MKWDNGKIAALFAERPNLVPAALQGVVDLTNGSVIDRDSFPFDWALMMEIAERVRAGSTLTAREQSYAEYVLTAHSRATAIWLEYAGLDIKMTIRTTRKDRADHVRNHLAQLLQTWGARTGIDTTRLHGDPRFAECVSLLTDLLSEVEGADDRDEAIGDVTFVEEDDETERGKP